MTGAIGKRPGPRLLPHIAAGLALLLLLVGAAAAAGPLEAEVAHLLRTVRESPCRFERNGTLHDGAAAAAHLERKYAACGGAIRTAEAFIDRIASASSLSGRRYRIHCAGQPPADVGDWLRRVLEAFRP